MFEIFFGLVTVMLPVLILSICRLVLEKAFERLDEAAERPKNYWAEGNKPEL